MRRYLLTVISVLTISAGTAVAGEFRAAPNATYDINLDSDEGSYSVWKLTDISGMNAARGRVTFHRMRTHDTWAPMLRISVGDGNDQASFVVFAPYFRTPFLVSLETQGNIPEATEVFAFGPDLQETFDFEMTWTASGKVTVLIRTKAAAALNGFERHEIDLGKAPTWFSFSGSTGEVSILPLTLGTEAP